MKIRTKLLVGIFSVFVLMLAGIYAIQHAVVIRNFEALQLEAARDDLRRCSEALRRDLEHLAILSQDWSTWDDTAKFAEDGNEEYARSNLNDSSFAISNFNLLAVINREGRVVWSGARDQDHTTPIELTEFPKDRFAADHILLAGNRPKSDKPLISGAILTQRGPMLVCARPILPSDVQWPARGTLIMGRLIGDELIERLKEQTRVQFELFSISSASSDPHLREVMTEMPSIDSTLLQTRTPDTTHGFAYVSDPEGNPALLIKASTPRKISAHGEKTALIALASLVLVGVVTGLVLHVLIGRLVITPVEQLAKKAEEIGISGDLTRGIGMTRSDEIGKFAAQFDKMVAALADSRRELMALSRRAGMADVATGVMHNIGNALTNANVLAETLSERIGHV